MNEAFPTPFDAIAECSLVIPTFLLVTEHKIDGIPFANALASN
jgi:hypothetical protein